MMSRRLSRVLWAAALILLGAALMAFNRPDAAPAPAAYASDAPEGYEPGQQLPDFTIALTDGASFSLSEHRGQVTVIKLPHFDRLQREHPDDVAVLAIHSDLITDDVAAYLANYDYGIAFAVDEGGQVIASVGGSTMLPQTLVLDRYGVVTYNQVGSVTYEALEELVAAAMAE